MRFAFALAAALLAAHSAAAAPCCNLVSCIELDPLACEAGGGVPGYCIVGAACGAACCDADGLEEIQDLRVAKMADGGIRLYWSRDPDADSWHAFWLTDARAIPGCESAGQPVQGGLPSTIPEAIHYPPAGAGDLLFYCASPACSAGTRGPTGACCNPAGWCQEALSPLACNEAGGFYQGPGTTCASASCAVVVADLAPCLAVDDMFYFDGDIGDSIHSGVESFADPRVFSFRATPAPPAPIEHVSFNAGPNDGTNRVWYFEFDSNGVGGALAARVYEDAQRYPFATAGHPGLDISGNSRGCNTITGRFQVFEIVTDCNRTLRKFVATFEQHCEGRTIALRGCIAYKR